METPPNKHLMLSFAYLAFISLGIDASLMGVAWPSVRATFNLPLDAVGLLFLAGTLGFFTASFNAGRIAARVGLGRLLLAAHIARVVGLLAFVFSPFWWGLIVGATLTSLGSASIDAGQNMYMSSHHKASHMNWMHANFGVGATIGPLIMTAIIAASLSWRLGYTVLLALEGVLAVIVLLTIPNWTARFADENGEKHATNLQSLRLPIVWLGIGLFFMYTGVEASAGQWSFTLFTESRAIPEVVAGRWVSIYWGMLTLGRILIGFLTDHVDIRILLRTVMIGTIISTGLIWWNPANGVSFAGLALLGLSLSTVFPVLVTVTPDRVGVRHAANSIGFQVGAAGVGGAVLSSLGGVLADSLNLEIIGPFLLMSAVVLAVLYEAFMGIRRPTAEPASVSADTVH
jgi:fucose permease